MTPDRVFKSGSQGTRISRVEIHAIFYSGLIYQAMGFPVTMFPVLFAIPRTSGWLAQWQEMLADPEQKIARPRQLYVGADRREFVPLGKRG